MAPLVINGRFPYQGRTSFIGVKIESITFDHESVTIRFGHETEHDFWQTISIHENVLCEWHAKIADALLTLAEDDPAYQAWMRQNVEELKTWVEARTEGCGNKPPWEGADEQGESDHSHSPEGRVVGPGE